MKNRLTQCMRNLLGDGAGTGIILVLLASLAAIHTLPQTSVAADDSVVWSIGRSDGSSIDFAEREKDEITFTIGESAAKKDFPARQIGSVSLDAHIPSGEKPYTVVFDLEQMARQNYELVVDFIFLVAAPGEIRVEVNGRKGIFPIFPQLKENIDVDEGNTMLLARQRLAVPIEAVWLKTKGNRITLVPLGVGGVSYDALSLRKGSGERASGKTGIRLEPTVFFRKATNGLNEVCRLFVPFSKRFNNGSAVVTVGREKATKRLSNPGYDFGVLTETVDVAVPAQPAKATIKVTLDGRSQRVTQDFIPARQWKLYICPKIHNDLGYTHIQPQVDELDTRNTDTVLDILTKYPFYKFNFETAWLMENYLDSRPPEYRDRLLEQMRQGRAGVNAFYFHLLTGLCSGEELYRSLYYAYRLHQEHGSNFNSACLTDAPSHTWFLPSLLADAGIRAFSNGSNQTRAPILALSNMNENSPFYWEGLDGERVMMWLSRS